MKTQKVSKAAAQRMWRIWRGKVGLGGWLLFDQHGNGGAWYSDNARPDMAETDIPIACPENDYEAAQTVYEFQDEVQAWLDARAEDRAYCEAQYPALI